MMFQECPSIGYLIPLILGSNRFDVLGTHDVAIVLLIEVPAAHTVCQSQGRNDSCLK